MYDVGEWVEITTKADRSWKEWAPAHDDFIGEIGEVIDIEPDPQGREGDDKIKVQVDFQEEKYRAGHTVYFLWFLKRHVSHSTKSDAKIRQNLRAAGNELQEWEKTKRKALDKNLKSVFGPEPKPTPKKVEMPEVEWEEPTQPSIPIHELDVDDFDLDNDWTGVFTAS